MSDPLTGRTVVVTRPRRQAASLARRLEELGASVVRYPTIRIRPPSDPGPLRDAARSVREFDWVVVTSVNGVAALRDAVVSPRGEGPALEGLRAAAIGPATARAAAEAGLSVEVVPGEYRAEALARALARAGPLEGAGVLLPRAAGARDVLPEMLREEGARVREVVAYETAAGRPEVGDLPGRLAAGEIDWLTFTASSTVENFVRMAGSEVGPTRVAAIGPVTAGTARDHGLEVHAVARKYTVAGLVEALVEAETGGREA